MPQITIRGGPAVKASTRRVDNIIFDSATEVELQYINYYYPENDRGNSNALDPLQMYKPYKVIRSNLIYNYLEVDYREASTSNYVQVGTETSENYSNIEAPDPNSYISLFDEMYAGQWQSRQNQKNEESAAFIVLEGDFRKTATKPVEHVQDYQLVEETVNDAFHFSINATNIQTSNPRLRVYVYRSLDEYEDAINNLDEFHSGLSSQLVASYDFDVENNVGWNNLSINIRDIDIPAGRCLLWFGFERIPDIIENPFDINSGEYTENFHVVNDGVYSSNIWVSSIDDWIDNDNINTRPFTIEIDGVQLLHETDFIYRLIKHREITRKLEITFLTSLDGLTNGVLDVQPRTTGVNSYGILNSWHRFSHGPLPTNGIATYPNRPSELDSWTVDSNDDIKSTKNSRSYIGFVSPSPIDSFNLEVDINSSAQDDDTIGVIVGYVKEDDYEYTLSAVRTQGGMFGGETWMLATNIGQSINFSGNIISNHISSHMWTNELPPANPLDTAGGWDQSPNGSKIRVEKNQNIVKVYTSQMNSTNIDLQTVIEIDLNDYEDTKRFINSRFGFSTFSQRNASFSNINFDPLLEGGVSLSTVKQGQMFVGGFAMEQAAVETYTRNPKENFEFIESITAERYFIENGNDVVVEKYKTYTFELYNAEEDNQDFVDLIRPSLYGGTILEYTNLDMILMPKKTTFEFSPFTGARQEYLTENIDIQLYGGLSLINVISEFNSASSEMFDRQKIIENIDGADTFKQFIESFTKTSSIIESQSDGLSIKESIIDNTIDVSLMNIKYSFEYQQNDFVGGIDFGLKDLTLSEFVGMADLNTTKKYGYELNSSKNILSEQDLVLDTQKGLYFFRPVDYLRDITKSLYIGKPRDKTIPINYGFQKYIDSADNFKRFSEIAKDFAFDNREYSRTFDTAEFASSPFYEFKQTFNILDKSLYRSVSMIEYESVKGLFFEHTKDMQFKVLPYYTETLDKTYIHKLFFVDIDMWNSNLKFSNFELENTDVSYMIEQFFLHTSAIVPPKTNIFGKQMLEEIFRPNFRVIDRVIEFFFDSFIGISSNIFDVNKFQPTFYDKITSGHIRSDGSNAYGHETIPMGSFNTNFMKSLKIDYGKENEGFAAPGRSGRHETGIYKETQEVTDINSSFLFEFSDVEWDLDLASTKNEVWGFNRENSNFNFIYEIDESSGRLPDCLKFSTEGVISGTLSETDKFLREYAFEEWTKTQGFTDNEGNFISHNESLDYDYTDFDPISPREFSIKILGTNITKGTIDLIPTDNSGREFTPGQKITQGDTTFFVGAKLGEFQRSVNLGSGTEIVTIIRHEIERLIGDININRVESTVENVSITSSSILSNNIASLDNQIIFAENLQEKEVLIERRTSNQSLLDNINSTGIDKEVIARVTTSESVVLEVVKNEDNLTFYVDDFVIDNSGAVVKEITVLFKIYNNFSFDRDLFLHKSDEIDDTDFSSRREWLESRRKDEQFRYDPNINNSNIDEEMLTTIKDFRDSKIDIVDYLNKKNLLIGIREYNDLEQRDNYEEFIDSLVFKETKFSNNYIVNNRALNSIDLEFFNKTFPIDITQDNRFKYLEDISDENGNFKLNCDFNVDEKTFYDNTDDIREIRGYPVYASCN